MISIAFDNEEKTKKGKERLLLKIGSYKFHLSKKEVEELYWQIHTIRWTKKFNYKGGD